jgi:monovalent cation/hydrogen antiporter
MHELIFVSLGLVVAVTLLVMVANYLKLSYPIVLLVGGLALSFVPGIPRFEIKPELIFLIFLPPLLFDAAWNTSWKDFWRWRRVILVFAFGLVFFTSTIVAVISWAVIPGFTLALGFLLGGIISPPDALAATSILKSVRVPKRVVAILEGESLINDASSLIVFRFALAAVLTGSFVWHEAIIDFSLVTVAGIAIGLVVALILYAVFRWLPTTPSIDGAILFTAPYLMYLTAESFHFSGVMAVVSGGLFISYRNNEIFSHSSRLQTQSMWSTIGFVMTGLVFMLIGLELQNIVEGMEDYAFSEALGYSLIISAVVIVTRLGFMMGTSVFTKFISKYITTADPNPGWKGPIIIGWAGMRGVVSLAAALSIPVLMTDNTSFPHRNLILFITFVVIFITLVVQGLLLPLVVRWVDYKDPDKMLPEDQQDSKIHIELMRIALHTMEIHHPNESSGNKLIQIFMKRVKNDVQISQQHLDNSDFKVDNTMVEEFRKVFSDVIGAQRQELLKFRQKNEFDEEVIRKHETQLDLEEERMKHRFISYTDTDVD